MAAAGGAADPRQRVPAGGRSLTARVTALLGIAGSTAVVLLLHVLRPDRSPVSDRLSTYAGGSYGWLMGAAFWSLGMGMVAFAVAAVAFRRDLVGRAAGAAAAVAGIGLLLSGLYPTGASVAAERIHALASGVATTALVALAIGWSLLAVDRERRRWPAGVAGAAAAAAVVSTFAHDTRWAGVAQRTLWVLLVVWLLRAAWERGYTS